MVFRIFVDSLFSQNFSKESAQLDLCLKELARDRNRWLEYNEKYLEELKDKTTLIKLIKNIEKKKEQ